MTVTELPRQLTADTATRQDVRWRPTRAGIINFWRLYDETFRFHDGRLLLRGPNGAGKSKALELLLPYLFDASLRPHRLSTFGGTERTMHWNLMGDGYDGTNRVGYVWLEFQFGDDEPTWFSCGARLQASTNTTKVNPTYFVTSQRIGVPGGLSLLGDTGAPLTRQALTEAIGDAGENFGESAGDYRRAVRQRLFAGYTEDKYDALITTLLQLRTPKLSEHLDPGVLSTLLSKALPPLDQADIAEIAEGFERLDRQREALAALDAEVGAADQLAARQRTYARRVIRSAAATLISATSTMDGLTRRSREGSDKLAEARDALRTAAATDHQLETEATDAQASIDGITISESYREGQQLDQLKSQLGQAERRSTDARSRADQLTARAEDHERRADAAADAAQDASNRATHSAAEAAKLARAAGLSAACEEIAATADDTAARRLRHAAVDSRVGQVDQVREVLAAHERAVGRREDAEAALEVARDAHGTAAQALQAGEAAHDGAVAALRADLGDWIAGCRLLRAEARDLARELAAAAEDEARTVELVAEVAQDLRSAWAAEETTLSRRKADLTGERDRHATERTELERHGERPPPTPHTRGRDRTGQPGAPLWRLVSFASAVSADEQAGIEAALEASGLLDAWITPSGTIATESDTFAAAEFATPATGRSLASVIDVEPDAAVPGDRVRQLLAGVAFGATAPDHVAAIGADGTWRLSAAHGRWTKPEPAYVGAVARERARERRLAELDALIAELNGRIAEVDTALAELAEREHTLRAELAARPPHDEVRVAAAALARAQSDLAARSDAVHAAERVRAEREQDVAARLRELTSAGARHGLPTNAEALDRLRQALTAFANTADAWLLDRIAATSAADRARGERERADTSREDADAAVTTAVEQTAEARVLAARVSAIEASIGVEYRQLVAEVQRLRNRVTEINTHRKQLSRQTNEIERRIGALQSDLSTVEQQRTEATGVRDSAADRFRELTAGSLADDADVDVDFASVESNRSALDAARRVAERLATTDHGRSHIAQAETTLSGVIHAAEQQLAGRADLSFELDDDVRVLTATVDGARVGVRQLAARLRADRDEARTQLTDSERDLFDRTLTGDTRRHLAGRIRQADELVRTMNQRLERVRTASDVRVSLVWQVDPNLPPGTREARDLLLRDPARISEPGREALHRFFRERVDEARAAETSTGWEQQLLQVLDYTTWHRFVVRVDRGDGEGWQPVTKRLHGTMSGGEKAVVLHLPLFAAAAAHYQSVPRAPRLILLDEVFVGIDSTGNRGQLLELLVNLDLDLVLTSDHEWCTYTELPGIAIHQLITGSDGDDAVTTARFVWDGRRKYADDEP